MIGEETEIASSIAILMHEEGTAKKIVKAAAETISLVDTIQAFVNSAEEKERND